MRQRIFVGILGLIACVTSWAQVIIDVHGTNQKEAELIIKQYGKEIKRLVRKVEVAIMKGETDTIDIKLKNQRASLRKQLQKQYGYLHVNIETIGYPNKKDFYATISVVPKNKPYLLSFIDSTEWDKASPISSKSTKKDLIDSMMEFSQIGLKMAMMKEIPPGGECPLYHCLVSFEHPKLKPYLAKFNQGTIKDKKLILNTLKNDPNPERRAAAALLIGHFKDPHEILNVITPYVTDKATGVRNNVMRVMASTIQKSKIYNIDLKPVIALLDSPELMDKNKAVAIICMASQSPANHKIILQSASDGILKLLALKQPNLHDWAYIILQNLSKKNFGQDDMKAWENWVSQARSQVA